MALCRPFKKDHRALPCPRLSLIGQMSLAVCLQLVSHVPQQASNTDSMNYCTISVGTITIVYTAGTPRTAKTAEKI